MVGLFGVGKFIFLKLVNCFYEIIEGEIMIECEFIIVVKGKDL